jgi:thymidylate synthase (FAD)
MIEPVRFLTGDPTIEVIAEMGLIPTGVNAMAQWVSRRRPECLPDGFSVMPEDEKFRSLFPHNMHGCSSNELLVELAGRKCYDSFGLKAGRKSNAEYIANTQSGDVPHASILYHAKMTFFIAGVSRRVSQEMMRNYVGADRDQEGAPSQESTRFTHHYGTYVAHPTVLDNPVEFEFWKSDIELAHARYVSYVNRQFESFKIKTGSDPKGMDRKRIYESAIGRLPWEFETSFVWTTNPAAIAKFCRERDNESADREMQRFAKAWKKLCVSRWPALFQQPWMSLKER